MKNSLIPALLILLAQAPMPVCAESKINLRSVNVTLPLSDSEFPGGASADVINNNCRSCHSAEFVLTQPNLSKAAWEGEVKKMINVMKAPISTEDAAAIVKYLSDTKGSN